MVATTQTNRLQYTWHNSICTASNDVGFEVLTAVVMKSLSSGM
jgi:hypothetical protein